MAPPAKKQRTALPALPTHKVSRSAFAATAAARTAAEATTQTAAPTVAHSALDGEDDYHPAQALPPTSNKTTRAITALAQMPSARAAEQRTTKALDLQRNSNRESYLAQCIGAVQTAPCKSCNKGQGPWKDCVVVPGFLNGSCANCHFGGEGTRCSLRPGKFISFSLSFLFSGYI
jgi:hypothetical protein